MSAYIPCKCEKNDRRKHWVVIQRNCSRSAFNGYKRTFSEYSHVICLGKGCMGSFRTKGKYVSLLPDAYISDKRKSREK